MPRLLQRFEQSIRRGFRHGFSGFNHHHSTGGFHRLTSKRTTHATNLLEPQLVGRRLGLSPLVVFVALIFWFWVLGPLGMILAVPITMALKIALDYSERWRWLALLVEPAPR